MFTQTSFFDNLLKKSLKNIIRKLKIKVLINSKNIDQILEKFDKSALDITRKITGENPAYIMFTSGSTGFPKGALITHDNILNLISWSIGTYKIKHTDILTNVNPLYFDNSVFDFYSALFSGACLVPFSKEIITNPVYLMEQINKLRCSLWFSVPSLLIYLDTMKALNKNNLKFVRRIIFGGEGYPKLKLKHLYDLYSNRCEIFNVYGPTECTCICSSYRITFKDFEDLKGFAPLGKIAPNFSYLILDYTEKKTASNIIGELCLLGPNVGKGYYNDPEQTQEKFIQNPYNIQYREIMYKTGDLVRYNYKTDNIYFIGRMDNQIKHMGYRIELEEIEAALNSLKYVSEAIVLHGFFKKLSQITAVICLKESKGEKGIYDDLMKILPRYMIPNRIFIEKILPKNPNGKIDRKYLSKKYY